MHKLKVKYQTLPSSPQTRMFRKNPNSLEPVFSGFSQHDEDKQSHLRVQREWHKFVQHDDETLKKTERWKLTLWLVRKSSEQYHKHQYPVIVLLIYSNILQPFLLESVCVCARLLFTLGSHTETIKMTPKPSSDTSPLATLETERTAWNRVN